jgi:hypothetical protein
MDPTDLPGYAGRIHDYFAAHPDRYRLMAWGRLELGGAEGPDDGPIRTTIAHKVDQVRRAQASGNLDPSWDPLDVLVLLNQIATSWADQPDLAAALPASERAEYLAARRCAVSPPSTGCSPRRRDTPARLCSCRRRPGQVSVWCGCRVAARSRSHVRAISAWAGVSLTRTPGGAVRSGTVQGDAGVRATTWGRASA